MAAGLGGFLTPSGLSLISEHRCYIGVSLTSAEHPSGKGRAKRTHAQNEAKRPARPWARPLQSTPHKRNRGTQPALDYCQQGNKLEGVQALAAPILQGPAPLGKHRSRTGRLYKSWFLLTPLNPTSSFFFKLTWGEGEKAEGEELKPALGAPWHPQRMVSKSPQEEAKDL